MKKNEITAEIGEDVRVVFQSHGRTFEKEGELVAFFPNAVLIDEVMLNLAVIDSLEVLPSYDRHGRMQYHPEFHYNHGKSFTEEEKAYICRYIKVDGYADMALAVGRTHTTVAMLVSKLKKQGKFEYYYKLWEELAC